jgi:hypothetical protein
MMDVIIALMMVAVSTSETSVNFYETTRRNVQEDSHLYTHRRENLKSHGNKFLGSIKRREFLDWLSDY